MEFSKKIQGSVNCIVLAIVAVGVVAFLAAGIQPFQRGFFCSDESLKYPYKDDTVSLSAVIAIGFVPVLITIFASEAIRTWVLSAEESKLTAYGKTAGWNLGICIFGMAFLTLLVEVVKLTIGRLRPHFFDVCKPDFSSINCSAGYVSEYTCTATVDEKRMKDAHKSFPSGHSSFICFMMTYIILYLQLVLPRNSFRLVRATLQFCAALVAFYVCASRVSDYKHHWSDVIGGAVVGIIVAVLTVLYISDMVPRQMFKTTSTCTLTAAEVEPSLRKCLNDSQIQRPEDIV